MSDPSGERKPEPYPALEKSVDGQVKKIVAESRTAPKSRKFKVMSAAQRQAKKDPGPLGEALTDKTEAKLDPSNLTWPRDWLALVPKGKLPVELRPQWWLHQDFLKEHAFRHYQWLDKTFGEPMVWRFTTIPTQEKIFLCDFTPDRAALLTKLVKHIGRHAGANIKGDPDICLQSFSRNLGAFIATDTAAGADLRVKNAINKALYICGISIAKAAERGISAHPALSKNICVVESEYVLVPTPGAAEVSIAELATVTYKNPFLGKYPVPDAGQGPAPANPDNLPALDMPADLLAILQRHVDAATTASQESGVGAKLWMHKLADPLAAAKVPTFEELSILARTFGTALEKRLS